MALALGALAVVCGLRWFERAVTFRLLLFDYRGYGVSDDVAPEAGLYLDGEAALAYVVNDWLGWPRLSGPARGVHSRFRPCGYGTIVNFAAGEVVSPETWSRMLI